jgi:hypothetical protein
MGHLFVALILCYYRVHSSLYSQGCLCQVHVS